MLVHLEDLEDDEDGFDEDDNFYPSGLEDTFEHGIAIYIYDPAAKQLVSHQVSFIKPREDSQYLKTTHPLAASNQYAIVRVGCDSPYDRMTRPQYWCARYEPWHPDQNVYRVLALNHLSPPLHYREQRLGNDTDLYGYPITLILGWPDSEEQHEPYDTILCIAPRPGKSDILQLALPYNTKEPLVGRIIIQYGQLNPHAGNSAKTRVEHVLLHYHGPVDQRDKQTADQYPNQHWYTVLIAVGNVKLRRMHREYQQARQQAGQ